MCYIWPKINSHGDSSMYELDDQEIELIVEMHNKFRDLVAHNSTPGQPGGIIPHV
uniref:Uncharacterized protein n=1 Tax=Romanomermis culicivorax TaxID=13658 RepID=A0A915KW14_ROMCU